MLPQLSPGGLVPELYLQQKVLREQKTPLQLNLHRICRAGHLRMQQMQERAADPADRHREAEAAQ